jgi:hypothetical protein
MRMVLSLDPMTEVVPVVWTVVVASLRGAGYKG